MDRLTRMFAGAGGALGHPPPDSPTLDTSEQVYISSLALLKMLKHAGVPMEVMGLMLGEFVDEYTVRVVDVFAMPQSGTGVSVEAVDHVFQTNMLDMLKQTGRPEMVVGWYHSHPGFGCWLSGVDINTQQFRAQKENTIPISHFSSLKNKSKHIHLLISSKPERKREDTMDRLTRMFAGAGGALGHPPPDSPTLDTSEQVYISSLALLKMLKHAGVPMEVMGLMLGEFVDEYTVRVVDVFAMPQSGTGVSVEAVDHVFQTNMLDMLKQTGRPEMVVGWYHSHPGFGCWLSGVDINTQQSFEALNQRAVAVVVDPIQSVKGKVVIDAFRLINPQTMMLGQEPRQTTSNLGHLNKPSIQALIHGLNRHYYSIAINYRKNELEEKMLLNLHKKKWTDGLTLKRFDSHSKTNEQTVQEMLNLAIKYNKAVQEEDELSPEKLAIANVGRQDAKKHLEEHVSNLMSSNIVQTLGTMLDTVVF
uniref:MPN domain-containing protein n=1 Tax=Chenopodium quinoa TaxID=63459 RepID=A0A803NCL5_CHEQI